MYRLQCLTAFAIIAAGIGGATSAQANMVVGNAVLIQQDVEGAFNDQDWTQTSKGDDVFEAEFIRTQVNSRANFALFDGSTIGLGATAIMKIDHVVLDPHSHSIQKLIVSAKDGAVRWISGNSMSGAYQIDTPHAVITDEGTAFDLVVEPQRTLVLLHTGRVTVCAKGAPGRCKPLSRRGEMVLVTTDDVAGPWESGVEPSGFETQCLNAKCAIAAFVAPPQPPSDGGKTGPERLPGPRHAVVPSQPETGEAPSRQGDTTAPGGPQIREVIVVPSGPQIPPQIPEVAGGLRNLWLYVQPGQPDPNVKKYPPPHEPNDKTHQGSPTDPNVNKQQGSPTDPNVNKHQGSSTTTYQGSSTDTNVNKHSSTTTYQGSSTDTNVKKHQGSSIDTNATTYRCGDCGNQGSSTDTNVKKYQGSSIDANLAKHPGPPNLTRHPDLPNLTMHPDLPNLTMHPGPPNLMKRSGPPNLMMRSGLLNLMMHSGPPNLMMRSGPPQLHLPGAPFRGFGGPR